MNPIAVKASAPFIFSHHSMDAFMSMNQVAPSFFRMNERTALEPPKSKVAPSVAVVLSSSVTRSLFTRTSLASRKNWMSSTSSSVNVDTFFVDLTINESFNPSGPLLCAGSTSVLKVALSLACNAASALLCCWVHSAGTDLQPASASASTRPVRTRSLRGSVTREPAGNTLTFIHSTRPHIEKACQGCPQAPPSRRHVQGCPPESALA